MRRVKPQKFTQEQINALMEGLQNQKMTTSTEKSVDPVNYPVFEVPVNSKVLIYVPNYEMTVNTAPYGQTLDSQRYRGWKPVFQDPLSERFGRNRWVSRGYGVPVLCGIP